MRRPLLLGHRGASADAPENTLAAFRLAQAQGADGIEFDVRLSADGWPVVFHDASVARLTNGVGQVAEMKLAALQALDIGNESGFPLLSEVFATLGSDFIYNIELKDGRNRALVTTVADCICTAHLEKKVILSSFYPWVVYWAKQEMEGQTAVAHLWRKAGGRFKHRFVKAQADHPLFSWVDDRYMDWAVNKNRLRVHVWTVDDPDEAQRLADLGVHAIITNKPGLIRERLKL
ncbi:MAG: glycerophosphodiester phosphodiesterase [Chloroflexi bacterium]|nr:glycerophosphodiester phosphodiesterase [Chloroflexota bacterium]